MNRPKGLTLLEALCALGLAALVLVLTARLTADLAVVSRRAETLSWRVTAQSMMEQLEFDAHQAVAQETTVSTVRFTQRRVDKPEFLPIPPDETWSVDSPSLQQTVTYSLRGEKFVKTTVYQGVSSTKVLGRVDDFQVEYQPDGRFVFELAKGKEQLRREVWPLCLSSLAELP